MCGMTDRNEGGKKERKTGPNKQKVPGRPLTGPVNSTVDFYCVYCNELFVDPPSEPWIRCWECKQWAHEGETDYEGIGNFVCDDCR